MSQFVQFEHGDPLKRSLGYGTPRGAGDSYGPAKGNGKNAASLASGLAVQYEGVSPTRQLQQHVQVDDMGWDRNDVPIPRNKAKRQARGPRDTRTSMLPEPCRVESVLDVYAEMYAAQGADEDRYRSHYSSNRHTKHEDLIPFQSVPQVDEPWDERGKNGLYGGGGRGADDRETGWVRGYSIGSSVPSVGFEEDLRYDDEGLAHDDEEHDTPRSSSETAQSGSYPVTPTSSHFQSSATTHDSPKSVSSPARSTREAASLHSRDPSTSQTTFRTPERPPRSDLPLRDVPLSLSDRTLLLKKTPQSAPFLTPSSPLPHLSKSLATPAPNSSPRSVAPTPKRSNSIFKKYGRSKKSPAISNPILPEGFVESLGMKTFTLTPGCKAPSFGEGQPETYATPRTPDRPPLPLNHPPRVLDSPLSRPSPPLRSISSARDSGRHALANTIPPPPPVPPAHSFDPSVHRQSDVYPQEAMARLSMASDTSTQSVPYTSHSTAHPSNHRQFFDQLRQERSKQEPEVRSDIPSIPLRPAQELRSPPPDRAWATVAIASREDERGHAIHYDGRADGEGEDSATSSYSEHSEYEPRRQSMSRPGVARDSPSYYIQSQHSHTNPFSARGTGGGYDRSSQVEMLEDEYAQLGAGPIEPLNFKRSPPLSRSTPPGREQTFTPRLLAQFNRGGGAFESGRNSTIDPLSSFAAATKPRAQAGPAIGSTGFRNPFG